jgi:hypothetical protein
MIPSLFKIVRISSKFIDSNDVTPSLTAIKISLSELDQKEIRKFDCNMWIQLLEGNETDWAANLCLYEIFKKDASEFKIVKTKDKWRQCCKKDDTTFWKNKFIIK